MVSVIVPIYHGQKYIPKIIDQIENASGNTSEKIELILCSDDPSFSIPEDIKSDSVVIKVLNTDVNTGIHATRIRGLFNAIGEYVLFLDQDDEISPNFFKSQIEKMGNEDGTVCRFLMGTVPFYDSQVDMKEVNNLEYYLTKRNAIISPGQVLLRRKSIPKIWTEHILKENGSDDFLLWIYMLNQGKKFALNDDMVFVHTLHDDNTSNDMESMTKSEAEVLKVIKECDILDKDLLIKLEDNLFDKLMKRIHQGMTNRIIADVYRKWIERIRSGYCIGKQLEDMGYDRVAIYGAGEIGKMLYREISEYGIPVEYYIDRNASYLTCECPVYSPYECRPNVPVIIISLVRGVEEIKSVLESFSESNCISVCDLIYGE